MWTKLLHLISNVHADVIREFYTNAAMEGERINCWLRGREFYVTRESIQEILEVLLTTSHTSLHYDERSEGKSGFVSHTKLTAEATFMDLFHS